MFPARPNLSTVAGGDASTAHFLAQLLCCDPAKRIGADASLGHKYFGDLDRTGHGADCASRCRKDGARGSSPEESLCAPLPDTVTEAEDMLRKKRARHWEADVRVLSGDRQHHQSGAPRGRGNDDHAFMLASIKT